jgi:hypothetical protein
MSRCTGTPNCDCGCCLGTNVQTPQGESNPPSLSAITYRTGTWATFKESMLARLSSTDYPALAPLKTRNDGDFTIALIDATAVVLDILTFYQERLANESYLRTAVQLRSLVELSRLIGYQPAPGVSASTYLAFTLKAATGSPSNPSTPAITIPAGTRVQSVPAQGQQAQTFETSSPILAKPDWNALPVQTGVPWSPKGSTGVYLSGTTTKLQLGDSLLLLGAARENWNPASSTPDEQWDVVVINQIQVDTTNQVTFVSWDQRISHGSSGQTGDWSNWASVKVFAFRQKVGLFGNNAPSPNLFVNARHNKKTSLPDLIDDSTTPWKWNNYQIADSNHIDLSTTCQKVVVGSWFALTLDGVAQLYKVTSAISVSPSEFGLSSKTTELSADYADPDISAFALQLTEVWAQSDQLTTVELPLTYPLYGTYLDLEDLRHDLANVQVVALTGKAQKLSVNGNLSAALVFNPDDQKNSPLNLKPGDVVTVIDPTPLPLKPHGAVPDWTKAHKQRALRVADSNGRTGTLKAALSDFTLAPSLNSDPVVMEFALVSSLDIITDPFPHTRILLQSNLLNCYDRTQTTVNANVGLATNGQSTAEILGNGSAATPNQSFTLKQSPLTFVQAPTPTGRQSTLQVTANGVTWTEVPSLYAQAPTAQVFSTLNQTGGVTRVLFGDGVEGSTLPTGQNNIQATYRVGLGVAGNVAACSITTLIDRPLGVSGVINPLAATGGQDAQSVDDIRADAPLSVLTLGRAVSITDYQNYAATFAGIEKAYAIWIPSGPGRGVFLTLAAAGGVALPPGNPTLAGLITSLQNYGNPLIPINAATFLETLFSVQADLAYDPAYDQTAVQAAVLAALSDNYSFATRTFGQGVSSDEIAAFIQAIPGVVAVNVRRLKVVATSAAGDLTGGNYSVASYNRWLSQTVTLKRPPSGSPTRICPYVPISNPIALPQPAEILVLDPDPKSVVLGVMS